MRRWRTVIVAVVMLLAVQAVAAVAWRHVRATRAEAARAGREASRAARAEAVYEAVLQHWMAHEPTQEGDRAGMFFVRTPATGLSDTLLARLARGGYHLKRQPPGEPPGRSGPMLELASVTWLGDSQAVAPAAVIRASDGAGPAVSWRRYHVRLERGTWRVVGVGRATGPGVGSVYEAVVRYLASHEFARWPDHGGTIFVSLQGLDPTDDFLEQFATEPYPVVRMSEARTPEDRGTTVALEEFHRSGEGAEVDAHIVPAWPTFRREYEKHLFLRLEGGVWNVVKAERRREQDLRFLGPVRG